MSRRRQKRDIAKGISTGKAKALPPGAVAADQSQLVPNNSWDPPPKYYTDIEFTCCDCGSKEVWSAQQQKWYYEIAKGSLYATAARCRECRKKQRESKAKQSGDPYPFKHEAIVLARLRDAIEPSLSAAGFRFDARNKPATPEYLYLDYSRGEECFRLSWDARDEDRFIGFVAELLSETGELTLITSKDLSRINELPRYGVTAAIQDQIDAFVESVNKHLNTMAG